MSNLPAHLPQKAGLGSVGGREVGGHGTREEGVRLKVGVFEPGNWGTVVPIPVLVTCFVRR